MFAWPSFSMFFWFPRISFKTRFSNKLISRIYYVFSWKRDFRTTKVCYFFWKPSVRITNCHHVFIKIWSFVSKPRCRIATFPKFLLISPRSLQDQVFTKSISVVFLKFAPNKTFAQLISGVLHQLPIICFKTSFSHTPCELVSKPHLRTISKYSSKLCLSWATVKDLGLLAVWFLLELSREASITPSAP